MAIRDQIRQSVDGRKPSVLKVPTPELPEHEGSIAVRRVSARELASHWQTQTDGDGPDPDERARFVVIVACDLEGSRIFEDADVAWLSQTAELTPMIERLYWAGRAHNGLTEENRRAWQKNSGPAA